MKDIMAPWKMRTWKAEGIRILLKEEELIEMKPLGEQILEYVYVLKRKYWANSVSLTKICYAMERHVRAVKPAVNDLIANGLLEERYEGASLSYAISRKGIDLIERNGLVKIRD